MGITNEVKNYFKARIQEVLNEKKDRIMRKIEVATDINAEALTMLDKNIPSFNIVEAIQTFQEVGEQYKLVSKQREKAVEVLEQILEAVNGKGSCWSSELVGQIQSAAIREYRDEIIKEKHPQEYAELKTIEEAMLNAEVAIMLATTEPKLVSNLTTVLERYGGALGDDLKEFVGLG